MADSDVVEDVPTDGSPASFCEAVEGVLGAADRGTVADDTGPVAVAGDLSRQPVDASTVNENAARTLRTRTARNVPWDESDGGSGARHEASPAERSDARKTLKTASDSVYIRPHCAAHRLHSWSRTVSDAFEITYAAHTANCTFLLDAEGICRRVIVAPNDNRNAHGKAREQTRAAARCVGAQYVASLDTTVSGMLTEMPRVGGSMLFARVDGNGRVSLVRTSTVTRFERHRSEDPFLETEKAPSLSVLTSAPVLTPSVRPSVRPRESRNPSRDLYVESDNERTQPIHALRTQHLQEISEDDETLARTSEYPSTTRGARDAHPAPSPAPMLRQRPAAPPPPPRSELQGTRTRREHLVRGAEAVRTPRASSFPDLRSAEKVGRGGGER